MTQITLKQLRPLACHTRAHCKTCRTDADWRERVTGVRDFECPHGVTEESATATVSQVAVKKITNIAVNVVKNGVSKKDEKTPAGPGTQLHRLIASKYGLALCQKCAEVVDRMNDLGVDGCRDQKKIIIDDIWTRRNHLKGWKGIAVKLPGSSFAAKYELGKLFDEAVNLAEQELKDVQTNSGD